MSICGMVLVGVQVSRLWLHVTLEQWVYSGVRLVGIWVGALLQVIIMSPNPLLKNNFRNALWELEILSWHNIYQELRMLQTLPALSCIIPTIQTVKIPILQLMKLRDRAIMIQYLDYKISHYSQPLCAIVFHCSTETEWHQVDVLKGTHIWLVVCYCYFYFFCCYWDRTSNLKETKYIPKNNETEWRGDLALSLLCTRTLDGCVPFDWFHS